VTARGKVQVYYDGRTIEADTLVYNRRTNRIRAIGNIRVTEPNGNIAYGQEMEFDQQFRDGFVRSLNVATPDRRYIGATNTTRSDGETTTFENSTYTACEPCRTDATRPPTWQIKSKRIIHKESEKTIYFEQSRLEIWGVPIAYIPWFFTPDGTESKRSGFLAPNFMTSTRTGVGVEIPYFWNIAPNYDLLLSPVFYSRQGVMPRFEWRHATDTGSYAIRAAGISQAVPGAFDGGTGDRRFRGSLQTVGEFRLAEKWVIGWDATFLTDRDFLRDYSLLAPNQGEANQRIYLRGQGQRSWFDLSATRYIGISATDFSNKQLPTTHPQLDYFRVWDKSIFGGEFGWRANVTSLTRESPDIISRGAYSTVQAGGFRNFECDPRGTAGTRLNPNGTQTRINNPLDCLVNGFDGTYTRASGELTWRRRIVDSFGQLWEPYFAVRGDVATVNIRNNAAVLGSFFNLADNGQVFGRVTPTAALTYRYPLMAVNSVGTTTIEPILQIVVRPNETYIGKFPNEDSQSLVFDDTNVIGTNRFSGWDRVEGGGRLNYGLNMTHRFTNGSFLNVLVGQSYHLFGLNSFSYGDPNNINRALDIASAGANSGLERPRSDYVARLTYQVDRNLRFSARGRFDERTFALNRGEFDATYRWGIIGTTGTLTYLNSQPLLGTPSPRFGATLAMSVRATDNWTIYGSLRYAFQRPNPDMYATSDFVQRNRFEGYTVGVSYLDECFQLGLFYSRDFGYSGGLAATNGTLTRDVQRFMFKFSLRTVGDLSLTQNASGLLPATQFGP
jgi:LPS-assembly protein